MGTDSRTVDEEERRKLIAQENNIIDFILSSDGGYKVKLLELAETLEKRRDIDPDLDIRVDEISKYITRLLRQQGAKIAPWVSEYLPEKYKDQQFANYGKLAHMYHEISIGSVLPSQPLAQLSNGELESFIELVKKCYNDGQKGPTMFNSLKEDLYREALNRGLTEIAGDKIRDQISSRDYRYEIPDYFGLAELNEEVQLQGNRWANAIYKFFNEKYPQRPATIRQKAWKYANAIRTVANLYETINEDKWSGDKSFWFEREFYSKIQSKHDSGNSTMFPTTLCANCSKDVDEDPKDCVRMKHWRPSPTGFLCEQCGGTEPLLRENTREQVGDKEGNVFRDAQDVLNYMPDYADVFIDYSINFKSPEIYARKSGIHGEFSKSAIGGTDKIVIPRKKTK